MTSKERAELRAKANGLDTLFQIGKSGVTDTLTEQTDSALTARELIKLRVLETSPLSVREAAEQLAAALGAEVVQVIGTKMVLYRESSELRENEKRKRAKAKKAPSTEHVYGRKKARAAAARRNAAPYAQRTAYGASSRAGKRTYQKAGRFGRDI